MFVMRRITLLICLVAVLAVFISGCCTIGIGPCTRTDKVSLVGSVQLNACGMDNKSHPVVVRFIYLKDTRKFQAGVFDEVWDDPAGFLGGDLADGYQDVTLAPGKTENMSFIRPEGATAVAMLVNFCDEKDINSRRHLFKLDGKGLDKTVELKGINFSIK